MNNAELTFALLTDCVVVVNTRSLLPANHHNVAIRARFCEISELQVKTDKRNLLCSDGQQTTPRTQNCKNAFKHNEISIFRICCRFKDRKCKIYLISVSGSILKLCS